MKVEKMKESRRWLSWLPKALFATLLAGALAFVGCKSDDDDDDDPEPVPVERVTVTSTTKKLSITGTDERDKTATLTAVILPSDADYNDVTWKFTEGENVVEFEKDNDDPTKATVTVKDTTGTVKITATAGGVTSEPVTIEVTDEEIKHVRTVSLSYEGNTTLDLGGTGTLTVTIDPSDAENQEVTWNDEPKNIVDIKTDDNNPLKATVTAKAKGPVTITATVDGVKSTDSVQITVRDPSDRTDAERDAELYGDVLHTVTLIEDAIGVQDAAFVDSEVINGVWRTYFKSAASGNRVAWLKEDAELTAAITEKAYVLTFDAAFTQKSGDFFAVTTKEWTSANDKSSFLLDMEAKGNDSWEINGINADGSPLGLVTLEPETFYHYTLKVTAGDSPMVLLTIKDAEDVNGNPVTNVYLKVDGNSYLAKSFCLSLSRDSTGAEQLLKNIIVYECPTVNIPVTNVKISYDEDASTEIGIGSDSALELTATLTPFYATNKTLTWESSDDEIATVDFDKETSVATVTGVAAGEATITVTAEGGDNVTADLKIFVTDENRPVKSVTLTPTTKKIGIGKTAKFKATFDPINATNKKLTWETSDPTIATVDEDGVVTAGVAEGSVTITATSQEDSTIKATATVDVVLYAQDYSDLEAVPLEWGGYVNRYSEGRGGATVSEDGYVILAGAADGNKGVFFATHKGDYNEKAVIANGEDYQLSFDFASVYYGNGASGPYKLLISNANGSALNTGDNPQGGTTTDANVLLSLEQLDMNSADWKVNGDTSETVTIEQYGVNDTAGNQVARVDTKTWHRFVVTRKGTETILQILKLDDEGNDTEVYSKTFESEVGGLGEIQFAAKINEGRQAAYFDNLIVTAY